jgi:hypothetical protein
MIPPRATSTALLFPCRLKVNAILRDLASVGALTTAHLDQLWGVTEQEGTYEGVKAHVYEGLAELVGAFSAEQVWQALTPAVGPGQVAKALSACWPRRQHPPSAVLHWSGTALR